MRPGRRRPGQLPKPGDGVSERFHGRGGARVRLHATGERSADRRQHCGDRPRDLPFRAEGEHRPGCRCRRGRHHGQSGGGVAENGRRFLGRRHPGDDGHAGLRSQAARELRPSRHDRDRCALCRDDERRDPAVKLNVCVCVCACACVRACTGMCMCACARRSVCVQASRPSASAPTCRCWSRSGWARASSTTASR